MFASSPEQTSRKCCILAQWSFTVTFMWPFSKMLSGGKGPFKVHETPSKFRARTRAKIQSLQALDSFAMLMDFYSDSRAIDSISVESDGDMLLFQWGTNSWGQDIYFEINLTRQLILPDGEDDDIWQLQLTYRYPPGEKLISLGSEERWCQNPKDILPFRNFVLNSPSLAACSLQSAKSVELHWEHV